MEKTLEAEDVGLLKHLLEMELRRLVETGRLDIALFMGVDGRIFTSYVPDTLEQHQFALLSLFRQNIPHICGQLQMQNMKLSIQYYPSGIVVISGVGENAFIAGLIAKETETAGEEAALGVQAYFAGMEARVVALVHASMVVKHIFELKPLSEETLKGYPPEVSAELRKLGRLLFKERFTQTKEYRKNAEILDYIKKKLATVLGKGSVEEVVTLTFNELGTSVGFMDRGLWMVFLESVISKHVARMAGEIIADECRKEWLPEVERKIQSFV